MSTVNGELAERIRTFILEVTLSAPGLPLFVSDVASGCNTSASKVYEACGTTAELVIIDRQRYCDWDFYSSIRYGKNGYDRVSTAVRPSEVYFARLVNRARDLCDDSGINYSLT